MPIQPIHLKNEANGLDWPCYLDGSSKKAPRIFIFSIALGADQSLKLDSNASYAPAFSSFNKLFSDSVNFSNDNSIIGFDKTGQFLLAFDI